MSSTNTVSVVKVSDMKKISECLAALPEKTSYFVIDTWLLTTQSGQVFNGGLVLIERQDVEQLNDVFERYTELEPFHPKNESDPKCIFVAWDANADEDTHNLHREVVSHVVETCTKAFELKPSLSIDDSKGEVTFISFKEYLATEYTPLMISALRVHPLLNGCTFRMANKRPPKVRRAPEVQRSSEQITSRGNFNGATKHVKPKPRKQRKNVEEK